MSGRKPQQPFARAVARDLLLDDFRQIERKSHVQPLAHGLGNIEHGAEIVGAAKVNPVPKLRHAHPYLALGQLQPAQGVGELGAGEPGERGSGGEGERRRGGQRGGIGHLDLEVTGGSITWGGAFWHRHANQRRQLNGSTSRQQCPLRGLGVWPRYARKREAAAQTRHASPLDGLVTTANIPPRQKNCVANLLDDAPARCFIARDGAATAKQ